MSVNFHIKVFKHLKYIIQLCTYLVDPLKTRRKRNILNVMYDQSRENENIYISNCNINLRSSNKVKMKLAFTRLTKVMKIPLYRGLELWDNLPKKLQTEPSKTKFKGEIKKYNFA